MENNLLEFSNLIERRKDIIKENMRVQFVLKGKWWYAGTTFQFNPMLTDNMTSLIELDEEDIKYFTDKYLPKLQEEMESKINKIREEYGK